MIHKKKELNRLMSPGTPMEVATNAPVRMNQSRHYSLAKKLATVALTLFGFSLLLTACSSSSPSTSTPTGNSSSAKNAASSGNKASSPTGTSFTAYSNCMKEHGVNFGGFRRGSFGQPGSGSVPPGTGSGTGTGTGAPNGYLHNLSSNPAFKKAETACASLRPKFPANGFGSNSAAAEKFAAYRNCLELHGVSLPTPANKSAGTTGSSTPATPGSTSGGSPLPSTLNSSDPTVKAALAACASLKPTFSPPTSTNAGS